MIFQKYSIKFNNESGSVVKMNLKKRSKSLGFYLKSFQKNHHFRSTQSNFEFLKMI
jgi:hypothetical protein